MKSMKFLAALLLLSVPGLSFAYSAGGKVDRDDLDNDIVEEFPIPVLFGVEYDDINPDFGDARDNGVRGHEGEDLLAPKGTPIVSPTEAIVLKVGDGKYSGKYVYTANPGDETFRYMHLDYIGVDVGDELDVGDFIGTVGDTGNAPDGVYHLHFETRDDRNRAQDPYPRIDEDGFTLKEKMSFLRDIFRDIRKDDEYAEFLVDTFPTEFQDALRLGYDLPRVIEDALEATGVIDQARALENLTKLIASLPLALQTELGNGDQGPTVVLLQLYLIYSSEGPARDQLRAAGPTGYFGGVTEAALIEYQKANLTVDNKGIYNTQTRAGMMKKQLLRLNLN